MGPSPFLPLPPTLSIDTVEQQGQTLMVHLHATSPTAPCPRCGMPGSRVHSRYGRLWGSGYGYEWLSGCREYKRPRWSLPPALGDSLLLSPQSFKMEAINEW